MGIVEIVGILNKELFVFVVAFLVIIYVLVGSLLLPLSSVTTQCTKAPDPVK
jgi:hypothetical protein